MNHIQSDEKKVGYPISPIIDVYKKICKVRGLPELETIIDYYDQVIQHKLDDLYIDLDSSRMHSNPLNPWRSLDRQDEAMQVHISELIGMKVKIEKNEMVKLFETFKIMYVDEFEDIHYPPITEVW
jgi:hypothetical protein